MMMNSTHSIKAYIHQKQLCVNVNQFHEIVASIREQAKSSIGEKSDVEHDEHDGKGILNGECSDKSKSDKDIDTISHSLSETCFIITEDDVAKYHSNPAVWLQRKESYLHFSLRLFSSSNQNSTTKHNNHDDDSAFLSMFSSLTLSSKEEKNQINDNRSNGDDENPILKTAAIFIVYQTAKTRADSSVTSFTNLLESNNNNNDDVISRKGSNSSSGGDEKSRSLLRGFSKTIFNKASNAVRSVLASYDLVEDPNQYNYGNDVDLEDDDAFNTDADEDYRDNDDYDDAIMTMDNIPQEQGTENGRSKLKDTLCEQDLIWNVKLLIDCWLLITHYMKSYIASMKDEYIDSCDQLASLTLVGNDTTAKNSIHGIILKRWGDDENSFLIFCKKAGEVNNDAMPSLYYQDWKEGIGQILSNLNNGTSLDLLLSILLESNHAILSPEKDLVILYPRSIYNIPVETKCVINEVDMAIFKLSSTIQSIEKRIDSLSTKSDTIKQSALSSKQSGNTKTALMHMKRRQIIVNEIDRCSTSLLNLETGLHTLKRARSDAQVLKAYEMVNETMKSIREETSISHVEEVMDEFHGGVDELDEVQVSLSLPAGNTQPLIDEDELEKELLALGGDSFGNDDNDNSTSGDPILGLDHNGLKEIEKEDKLESGQLESTSTSATQFGGKVVLGG